MRGPLSLDAIAVELASNIGDNRHLGPNNSYTKFCLPRELAYAIHVNGERVAMPGRSRMSRMVLARVTTLEEKDSRIF